MNTWLRKHWQTIAVAAAAILYVFLAVYRLSRQDGLPDEAYTLLAAEKTPLYLVIDRLTGGHVPLYFLLVRAFLSTGIPVSLPSIVAPSIILGLAGLFVFYRLALRLGLGGWSVLAVLLWAVHPNILYHCRLARPTAGALLIECAILTAVCGLHRCRAPKRRIALLALLGITGAMWMHLLAANWLMIYLALFLPRVRGSFDPRLRIVSAAMVALHAIAILICFWAAPLALSWVEKLSPQTAMAVLWQTFGSQLYPISKFGWPWLLALLLWCVWIGTALSMIRSKFADERWLIISASVVLPILAMMIISIWQPMMHERYLTHFLPVLILCAANFARRLPRIPILACSVILIAGLANFDRDNYRLHDTGMRPAIRKIEELTTDRDAIGVSYQVNFPQMLKLFSQRPHRWLLLDPEKENASQRQEIASHLSKGGLLWEFAPLWFPARLWEEMRDLTGEASFQKSYPIYIIRIYDPQSSQTLRNT